MCYFVCKQLFMLVDSRGGAGLFEEKTLLVEADEKTIAWKKGQSTGLKETESFIRDGGEPFAWKFAGIIELNRLSNREIQVLDSREIEFPDPKRRMDSYMHRVQITREQLNCDMDSN